MSQGHALPGLPDPSEADQTEADQTDQTDQSEADQSDQSEADQTDHSRDGRGERSGAERGREEAGAYPCARVAISMPACGQVRDR